MISLKRLRKTKLIASILSFSIIIGTASPMAVFAEESSNLDSAEVIQQTE